jgi:hypothetical protein
MRKFAISIGGVALLSLLIASLTSYSQVNKEETHSHTTIQKSVPDPPAPREVVSTPKEDEPTHLEPVSTEPKAKIVAPTKVNVKSYVVLDFTGTASSIEPDFDVVFGPEGSTASVKKLYNKNGSLAYGLFIPEKAGKYRIALVAFATSDGKVGTVRSYAFADIEVSDLGKPPEPGPNPHGPAPPLPAPPGPTPQPQPKKEDTYGMYAYTRDLLAQMPAGDAWQSRIPLIYDSFDKMIAQSSGFTDATKFVQATSDLYKSALGDDYNYFSHHFFTPLKTQLGKVNSSGKLPSTTEAHAEAWREISQALHEVKPVSSMRRSSEGSPVR